MDFYKLKTFDDILNNLLLRKYAPLKNEIQDIFVEEFGKEHSTYYSILSALAQGKNTKKEINDLVSVKSTSLSPYLYDLINLLDIVAYELPLTQKPSKKGRYVLKDNFFEFWFRFIYRNYSYYESEKFIYLKDLIEKQLSSFIGRKFENICKELLSNKYLKIKRQWGKFKGEKGKNTYEIDLVGIKEDTKEILFCECKWQHKVNADIIINELSKKAEYVDWFNDERNESYAVFAKSFSKKITLFNNKKVHCYDLKEIENFLK